MKIPAPLRAGSQSEANLLPDPPPPHLHPEICSIVQLADAHVRKEYFSGPLDRWLKRQPSGQHLDQDEGWTEVWARLIGTTLSIWDMKELWETSKRERDVPPSYYVNVADACVQLHDFAVAETSSSPIKRYTNIFTLNTADSNLLVFSCPSTGSLISWVAALRLSAWEKSRLDEIYTAHLIRISGIPCDAPTTLIRGEMEGWVRIRVAGQTDWMRVWMVVSSCTDPVAQLERVGGSIGSTQTRMGTQKKNRILGLFSRETNAIHLPIKPVIRVYLSNRSKDMKKALLTITDVAQAFSVYPDQSGLVSKSALIKLDGTLGDEEFAGSMRSREACVFVMPEFKGKVGHTPEMLKWVTSFHDAFRMYGRPKAWTLDPRHLNSLIFAYPVGPLKDLLFLDRQHVEALDLEEEYTSTIRSGLLNILLERMRGNEELPPFDFVWATASPAPHSIMSKLIEAMSHLGSSFSTHLLKGLKPIVSIPPRVSNIVIKFTISRT